MLKKYTDLTLIILVTILFSSCASKRNTVYFQSDTNTVNVPSKFNEEVITADDILNISVTALDMTSITPFIKEKFINSNMEQNLLDGYKVDANGDINFPLIGNIKVADLTTKQAALKIQELLSKSIIDPIAKVSVLNYNITILGEVQNPGTFKLFDPKITIIQALGLAGDITIYGKKKNIKVIREINGNSVSTEVDLTNSNFISSDFYYLRKNDVVYVEPTFAQIKNSGYIGQITNITTILSLIFTHIVLLSKLDLN